MMRNSGPHAPPLLVVEDNEADFETISLLLKENGFESPILHCNTGEKALAYVAESSRGPSVRSPLPAHILLDLNLPGVSGLEVLTEVRKNEVFASTPVTILTTSSHPRDIEGCYRAGASSYMIKPVDFGRFETILRTFATYWFDIAELWRPGDLHA